MALQVLESTVTIPGGTATDTRYALPFTDWEIAQIDLEVPPGPAGLLAFYLANNGVPWIPRTPGQYLVWDDHAESFPVNGYPIGQGWQIIGHNNGHYDHTVRVRFHVNDVPAPALAASFAPVVLTFVEHGVKPHGQVVL